MNKPFLYIHIPKTAGVMISKQGIVNKKHWSNHSSSKGVDHSLARDIKNINKFFTFCFLRNPYDKMLSSYNFHKNYATNNHNVSSNNNWPKQFKKYKTFKDFILDLKTSKNINKRQFVTTQHDYITNKNGKIIVDFVGDFYKIDTQFYEIQEINKYHKSTIKLTDKKINITPHSDFRDYYNDEVAEIVYNHWKKDFIELNFDKDSYKK